MPSVLYPFILHDKSMKLKVFIPNWEERKPKFKELKKTTQCHRALTLMEVLIEDKITCLEKSNKKRVGGSNRERNSWDPSFLGSYFSLKKIGLIGRSRRCHRLAQKSAIKATCSGGKVHLKTGSKDSWWGEKSVFLFCITIFLSLYSTYQQLES